MPNADSADSAGALSWPGLICGRLAPASGYTAALAPSSLTPPPKGLWLIRCTVDGLTPNRSAICEHRGGQAWPARPVWRLPPFRVSAAALSVCPHYGPAQSRRGLVPESSPAQTRRKRPSSGTLPCPTTWWCRCPVGEGKDRSGARVDRTGTPQGPAGYGPVDRPTRPSPCRIGAWPRPGRGRRSARCSSAHPAHPRPPAPPRG
jgi:hypothetical protein